MTLAATVATIMTASQQSSPSQPDPSTTSDQGSSSKAWIAAAVVGPVFALAIIGASVWLLLKKKSKGNKNAAAHASTAAPNEPRPGGHAGYYPPSSPPTYPYGQPEEHHKVYHEAQTDNGPLELPASNARHGA